MKRLFIWPVVNYLLLADEIRHLYLCAYSRKGGTKR